MLPADDVETFEGLVDEIERVPTIGVGAVGLGGKEEICECRRRSAGRYGGEHGAFGRLPMAHGHPAPKPALQGGEVGSTCQRTRIPAWRCTFAVLGHAPRPVKQSKVRLLLRQQRQKLTERGQNGEPDAPAITIAGAEQSRLPYHLRRWSARRQLTVHGLGDDEAEIVGESIGKPLTPMLDRVGIAENRPYPDLAACADLDGTSRHIVCP